MGGDTILYHIFHYTYVCMIVKSHATFVSHLCPQGTVKNINSY
jgi:hypothetical protein